jgi:hypothetical protein
MFRSGSRHWVRSKVFLAAAGTAAILLAAGGTALAVTAGSVPVSKGQVEGCYARTSGALRVLTPHAAHCKPGEKGISWPQKQSSINGYASTFKYNIGTQLTTTLKPIVTLKLPRGSSYMLSATADLETFGQTQPFDWAQCEFFDGTTTKIGFALTTIPYDSSFGYGFSTLASTAYSPNGGTITMKCSDELGQAIIFSEALTATQVNHLTLGAAAVSAPRGARPATVKLPSTR